MNTQMFAHEAVRRNLDTLAARGVRFVEPGEGYLACGWIGKGRLAEPDEIVAAAEAILRPDGPLRGQRVLVTAGPTYEDFDPVRYVGNRSSGRMGFAIAAEAARRGAEVTLVAGPTTIEPPPVARGRARAQRRGDAQRRDRRAPTACDVVVMAAAVADYTPAERAGAEGAEERRHADARAEADARHSRRARAAARWRRATGRCWSASPPRPRTSSARATAKRERKHVDLIVANDVSRADAGFDVDTNAVTIVGPDGAEALPLQSKARVAAAILDRVEKLLVDASG